MTSIKPSKFSAALAVSLLATLYGSSALAAVSAEEAKQLGTTLTPWGAEKAGNKEGTIPEYTGGLPVTTSPSGFVKGSGKYPTPFPDEKPLFSITAQNVAKYADKLAEGQKELLKRNPTYRLDVYPTHRTVNFPKWFLDQTMRNATEVKLAGDGLALENYGSGLPFPIPKTGMEAALNHELRWGGSGMDARVQSYYVTSNGEVTMGSEFSGLFQWPQNQPGMTPERLKKEYNNWNWQAVYTFLSPSRIRGDGTTTQDNIDPVSKPRLSYSYSASTRRVRLAPDIAYDTPIQSAGGVLTYDEGTFIAGKLDRFSYKLLGKKEMYIPYNNHTAAFYTPAEKLFTPKYVNPDYIRWELHRVWIVEATLKPEYRHIYSKRVFYLDEDGSSAGVADEYDGSGKLYKQLMSMQWQAYDISSNPNISALAYDFSTGIYAWSAWYGCEKCHAKVLEKPSPQLAFTPDALVARSKQ